MSVGKIGPFDLEKGNWEAYVDRLEQYFVANSVKEELQVATLITVMGSDTYDLMVNLCTPVKPAKKSYKELVKLMKGHLSPKPSMLAERFKFRQRIQKSDENIANYVAELKKMSKDCGFDAESLRENLRDQFVCGLIDDDIRQKLFTEDDTITFDRAYKIAVSMEAAATNAALVEDCTRHRTNDSGPLNSSSSGTAMHQLRASSRNGGRGRGERAATRMVRDSTAGSDRAGPSGIRRAGSGFKASAAMKTYSYTDKKYNEENGCQRCGGKHESSACKFKSYVCRVCNKEGHLKKMCPNVRGRTSLHNLDEEQVLYGDHYDSESSDEVNHYSLDAQLEYFKPYTVDITIEEVNIEMEIDTGSAISCISLDCYNNWFSKCKLKPSNLILRYYTGESVTPVGKFTPTVKYKDLSKRLTLFVIKSGKTCLLGRNWLEELRINIPCKIYTCNNVGQSCCEFNVEEFSSRYCEVFEDKLGRFTGGTVGFRLRPDARPMFLRARPLAYALRAPVERALDQMVKDGIISPVTTSDWATPIVPVMKKDGTIRVCADFKLTLNKCLEVDHYPLPKVEDLLVKLHGGEKFTKLDLSQAYAQFELDDSKKYTVVNTHKGLFIYNRLIYGLASSPGIFQRKLEQLFADLPRVGVFLDDLILTGEDNESHLATLHEVFRRLQKYGLKIKKEKCTFFADSVTYLGFVISKRGVHTCPNKIDAIKNAPVPSNITELRSFLGLVMYYARFVPNLSTILGPLYQLLRKEVRYEWNDSHMRAFNTVKSVLISSEVLAHYSPELPLVLTTDASGTGVGAVISHLMPEGGERPIAYASRVLNAAEKSYSQIEREALAIIYGVRKFHQYLYGRRFILRTDHKPLVSIFGDKIGIPVMAASRMQRWAVILSGYDYKIEYVRSENNAADALSRLPLDKRKKEYKEYTYLNFIQNFLPITRKIVLDEICKDDILQKVVNYINTGWPKDCKDEHMRPYFARRNELYVDRGCIIWGYRLVIPSDLRQLLLKELHMGHLGIVKMKSLARSVVWWPGIDQDIEQICKTCTTCALEGGAPPRATPQPWPYISEPWSRLHVDFLGPFHGKTFLVIIDATSKWLEVFLMPKTTAAAVIKVLRETFARFGLPKEIVSDNGPPFSSREYTDFMRHNDIKVTFTPVYHPSSNGAAENAVKLCKRAIRKSVRDGTDLDAALQTYLLMYRNVEHCTTGLSPAMHLQRRRLRSRLDLLREDRQVETTVKEAQNRQVRNAGGTERKVEIGDTVWARDYTGGKWIGGIVTDKLGSRNYVIGRESGPPIKRHIDQLKKRCSSCFDVASETEVGSPNKSSTGLESVGETVKLDGKVVSEVQESSAKETSVILKPVESKGGSEDRNISNPEVPVIKSPEKSKRKRNPVKRYGLEID